MAAVFGRIAARVGGGCRASARLGAAGLLAALLLLPAAVIAAPPAAGSPAGIAPAGMAAPRAAPLPVSGPARSSMPFEAPADPVVAELSGADVCDHGMGFAGRNFDRWAACQGVNALSGVARMFGWVLNNPFTRLSDTSWAVSVAFAARVAGVASVVAVGLCAVEIVAGLVSRNTKRAITGFLFALGAWPLTVASLLLFGRLAQTSNLMADQILASYEPAGAAGVGSLAASGAAAGAGMAAALAASIGAVSWWLILILVAGAILALVLLIAVLVVVTYGQILVAAFSPMALMLAGFKGTRPMAAKWARTAVSLLLVKPVIAGIIAINLALVTSATMDGIVLGTVGMMLAVLSPAAVFSLVGFAGVQLGNAMTAAAGAVKGAARGHTAKSVQGRARERDQERDFARAGQMEAARKAGAGGAKPPTIHAPAHPTAHGPAPAPGGGKRRAQDADGARDASAERLSAEQAGADHIPGGHPSDGARAQAAPGQTDDGLRENFTPAAPAQESRHWSGAGAREGGGRRWRAAVVADPRRGAVVVGRAEPGGLAAGRGGRDARQRQQRQEQRRGPGGLPRAGEACAGRARRV